jgi:protein-tyrosine phosphatase
LPRPRGGDWLADEIRSWKDAGVDVAVSLLEPHEVASLDLQAEDELSRQEGIEPVPFSIPDRGVPESKRRYDELIRSLFAALKAGRTVGVHCRQGIGRSAIVAAGTLVLGGAPLREHSTRLRGNVDGRSPKRRNSAVGFSITSRRDRSDRRQ